jgi:leucyl-tRNA synthetase
MKMQKEWQLNFDSAPFCNGSLHLGHVRNYVLGDIRARWLRKRGVDVTYLSALDAFGLPNEEGARRKGISPDRYVPRQAERIDRQVQALNLSYSRRPLPLYSEPSYYRWTQWLFLRIWELGLIYHKKEATPYCPSCDSFLASAQIQNDLCWRCEGAILLRESEQWYIRTSVYMDRLYEGINDLSGWSERARNILRSFMGRLEGECTDLLLDVTDRQFRVRLFSDATSQNHPAIGLRADHPLAVLLRRSETAPSVLQRSRRSERQTVRNPGFNLTINGSDLPVYIYSPGDLPAGIDALIISDPSCGTHRAEFSVQARTVDTQPSIVYRTQDWLVSRNRSWGTPLPAVACTNCGVSPVAETDLPIRLEVHGGDRHAKCGTCGTRQRVVARVLDCFFDDAWCFYATAPGVSESDNPFEAWRDNPPSYVHFHAGYDTFVYLHVFRFIGYVLHDLGYSPHPEPISFYHGHDVITAGGRKMSKRHQNAPDLDSLLERWGSDTVRLSVLVNTNPGKTISWSENRLRQAESFLALAIRLVRIGPGFGNGTNSVSAPSALTAIRKINARLVRVDKFIEEYRIGAALDQLFLATRDTVRTATRDHTKEVIGLCEHVLSFWKMFAPEIMVSSPNRSSTLRPGVSIERLSAIPGPA